MRSVKRLLELKAVYEGELERIAAELALREEMRRETLKLLTPEVGAS